MEKPPGASVFSLDPQERGLGATSKPMLHLNRRSISNSFKARPTFSASVAYMQIIIIRIRIVIEVNFPLRRQKLSRKIAPDEGMRIRLALECARWPWGGEASTSLSITSSLCRGIAAVWRRVHQNLMNAPTTTAWIHTFSSSVFSRSMRV